MVVCCLAMNKETFSGWNCGQRFHIFHEKARGGLLDYDAVLHHLKSGHLGALETDVFWAEPFDPDDAILKFSNVIMTPHVAGVTEYSYRSMAMVLIDSQKRALFSITVC